jgi:hypothetical protein
MIREMPEVMNKILKNHTLTKTLNEKSVVMKFECEMDVKFLKISF